MCLNLISHGILQSHAYAPIVNVIRNLIEELVGNVIFRHVYREENTCADGLAKYSHSLPIAFVFFESLPPCISLEFLADLVGQVSPRTVLV